MRNIVWNKKNRLSIYSSAGLLVLGLLLSAGAIAQNSTSDTGPQVTNTVSQEIREYAASVELAELKERIEKLEAELTNNIPTAPDSTVAHDHATMDHGTNEMVYEESMADMQNLSSHNTHQISNSSTPQGHVITEANEVAELKARIEKLESELQKNSQPLPDHTSTHDHTTMDSSTNEMVHDASMGNMHGGCMGNH